MSKKRPSSEDTPTIDRKRSKVDSIEPAILGDVYNNNNLYKNLFLYEALHDFSKSRGKEYGLNPNDIRNYIGLYINSTNFPIANDEDRFIEDIDSGQVYNETGTSIVDIELTHNTTITNSIDYYNQFIIDDHIIDKLATILEKNDIVEVYFDYYKENKGKWLDLKTVNSLKTMISYIFSINNDDNKLRFLVDTCKLNLAMVYYNTPYSNNDNIYQIVDETNKWDMASTRKNNSQIQSSCLDNPKVKLENSVTMSIPISSSKSKKEYRKIAYNLLSENLLPEVELDIEFPTTKLDSGLDYVYTTIDNNKIINYIDRFVLVPTITSGIQIMIGNIVYRGYGSSECYSTTIISNKLTAILLVNQYAYSESQYSSDDEDIDNIKGVFSVNMIKKLLAMDNNSSVYKILSSIYGVKSNTFKSLLFDIKRSGDWSQILAVYKQKDKMNNVFITIDRMAFEYAKLLKVPAILTSKDYGSDTYRFRMYRDKTVIMSEEDRKALVQKRNADLQRQVEKRITEGITNEYNEKYNLAFSIYTKIKNKVFKNNIDTIQITPSIQFTNKPYINNYIYSIWQIYKTYIGSQIDKINRIYLDTTISDRAISVEKMAAEIPLLNKILETYNINFNIQKYLDTSLTLPENIFNPIKNDNNKIQWLLKAVKECIVCPSISEYMASILENIATLFIGTTKRSFKINEENIVHLVAATNGLTTVASYGSLVPVLTKATFNEKTLVKWFETTRNLLEIPKTPEKTKIVTKPVHHFRSSRKQRGGSEDSQESYKYFLPGKINKKTVTPKDMYSLYNVLDEYLGYISEGGGTIGIISGQITYKNLSKFIDQYAMEYINALFTPDYIEIVKLYINYSVAILGLGVENIDEELAGETDTLTIKKLKHIYGYFQKATQQDNTKIDNNKNDIEKTSEMLNINESNNYLDEIENSEAIDNSDLMVLPIENIYKQLDIDIRNPDLDLDIKLVYYYLITLAITELGINNNPNDISYIENTADFVVEPANQYYKDLDNLIDMFKEIEGKAVIVGGSTDIEKPLEYKDYFREAVTNKSRVNTQVDIWNISAQYLNEFSLGINNLNNYYIELLLQGSDNITCETYMGIAATLKSIYSSIYNSVSLYMEGYYSKIELLDKIKIQTSRLSLYHDSTLATLDKNHNSFY